VLGDLLADAWQQIFYYNAYPLYAGYDGSTKPAPFGSRRRAIAARRCESCSDGNKRLIVVVIFNVVVLLFIGIIFDLDL
jgi:hypothetical protein